MKQSVEIANITKTRSDTIQVLRAIAIAAVVLAHTCPYGMYTVICRPLVNYCVPLFLFLSGYLTNGNVNNWNLIAKRRLIRVLIPYVIWTVIYTLESGQFNKLLVNVLTTNAAAHLYYIFVYMQFVILTPLLIKLAKSRFSFLGWLVAPAFILAYKYIPLLSTIRLNTYLSIICWVICLGWFTFYYLGLVLGNRIVEKQYSLKVLAFLFGVSLILQMAEGYVWTLIGGTNPGTVLKLSSIISGVLACLIAYTILERGGFASSNKILKKIGDYSFGIYLSHVFVLHLLKRIPIYDSIPFVINSSIVLLISFGLCYIGDKAMGKPMSKWLGFR